MTTETYFVVDGHQRAREVLEPLVCAEAVAEYGIR